MEELWMKIRYYRSDDNIKPLISEAVENIDPECYSQEQQKHLEEVIPEMNLEFAEKDRYSYFVAKQNGKIVGVAGFQKEKGTVAGIFVDSIHQGEGIGRELMQKIEEKTKEEALDEIKTLASLEAVDFYNKNGYKVTEEKKQDIEGKDIGIKVMTKYL